MRNFNYSKQKCQCQFFSLFNEIEKRLPQFFNLKEILFHFCNNELQEMEASIQLYHQLSDLMFFFRYFERVYNNQFFSSRMPTTPDFYYVGGQYIPANHGDWGLLKQQEQRAGREIIFRNLQHMRKYSTYQKKRKPLNSMQRLIYVLIFIALIVDKCLCYLSKNSFFSSKIKINIIDSVIQFISWMQFGLFLAIIGLIVLDYRLYKKTMDIP